MMKMSFRKKEKKILMAAMVLSFTFDIEIVVLDWILS